MDLLNNRNLPSNVKKKVMERLGYKLGGKALITDAPYPRNWASGMNKWKGKTVIITSLRLESDNSRKSVIQFEGSGGFAWVEGHGHFTYIK